ncbi:MAG: ABC transporter ATP-binding protein/permease [Saccharofermentans sp.]|nr:ABC transporter ATP-binding protein/permease [Saccharofermentans sp.]
MKNIFKFLLRHKVSLALVLILLILQAYCDLALPSYTSDLLNVGLQQGGISNGVPESIREDELEIIKVFVAGSGDKLVEQSYSAPDSKGIRYLNDDVDIDALNKEMSTPECIIFELRNAQGNKAVQENEDVVEEGEPIPTLEDLVAVIKSGQVSPTEFQKFVKKQFGVTGEGSDMLINQIAVRYVAMEYEAQGKDMNEVRNNYLYKVGAKMLAMSLVMTLAAVAIGFISSRMSSTIGFELRNELFSKVMSFTDAEMERFSSASLITRATNDVQQIQFVSVMLMRIVLYAPILAIGGVLKIWNTNTGLSWIIVVAVISLAALVGTLFGVTMPRFKLMQTLIDRLNLVSREILNGVMPIRAFSRESHEEKRFDEANTNLYKTQLFTNRVMTFMMPIMMLLMNGMSVAIVWYGAKGVDTGKLQVGDLTAFITYSMVIVMGFLMIGMICIMLPRAGVAADRIVEVLNTEVSLRDPEQNRDEELKNVNGELAFNDVTFAYPGADEPALTNISFKAEPAKVTAIIGSTGCGKSTLVKLIPRFFDVTSGSITVNGIDIREFSQNALREVIGYVPQKGNLFSGTIETNIKYGGDYITDEDMKEAAQIAQATEFIESKENKYDSEIAQGGTNVSGGQRQRLSIARAIAKNPKIFIFDDSFSALDYKTDLNLRKALAAKTKNASVIIVAQRISTILTADQIIVLEDGRIVGKGTHLELMNSCEVYKQIASSQLSESELAGASVKGGAQ